MKKAYICMAVSNFMLVGPIQAVELSDSLTFQGFGTLGLAHSDNDDADFVAIRYFQPKGAGRSNTTSYNVDTKAGLQLDWKANDRLSLTGQLLSKKFEGDRWTPEIEWAFAKFRAAPELDIRLGRIRPAIYMLSDYLDVNFANPWVRPPVEFYSSAPVSRMEGVDMLWRPTGGAFSWLVQPYLGKTKLDVPGDVELEAEQILGLNISVSGEEVTLRAGYVQSDITVRSATLDSVIGALNAICGLDAVACTSAASLAPNAKDSSFASLGASWDNGDVFITGEYGKRKTDSFQSDATTWYLSGGARLGKWSPFLTYSAYRNDSSTRFAGSDAAGTLPLAIGSFPAGTPTAIVTNTLVTALLQNNPMDQHTVTVGVRYDMMKNLALKAQWDHVATQCKSPASGTCGGMFIKQAVGFADISQDADLISVSVDFTF